MKGEHLEENRRIEQSPGGFAGWGSTSRAGYPLANSGPSERSEVSRRGDQRRGLVGRAARRPARAPGGQRSNNLRTSWFGIFRRGRKSADQKCAGSLGSGGMIWIEILPDSSLLSVARSVTFFWGANVGGREWGVPEWKIRGGKSRLHPVGGHARVQRRPFLQSRERLV